MNLRFRYLVLSTTVCIGTALSTVATAQTPATDAWTERVRMYGDFRYRQEYIKEELRGGVNDAERHRGRIRARLGVEGKVNDEVKLGLRLATTSGGDRVSFNQDLGDNGSKKEIYLDWAFVQWSPNEEFSTTLGKFGSPFVVVGGSQMIWDVDYSPEGLAVNYKKSQEALTYEAHLASYWMVERNGPPENKDSGMLGAQLGASYTTNFGKFGLFVANYIFTNFKGQTPVQVADGNGNSLDATQLLENDYNLINVGLVYEASIFELPIEFYADLVQNTEAKHQEYGRLTGFNLGKIKEAGDWRLSYNWRKVEADATLAGLNDSDFAGGDVDSKGHTVALSYGLTKGIDTGLTYFMAEKDIDNSIKYDRVYLDLNVKF